MHVRRLVLRDVRTYAEADLQFEPGVVAFVGANGQGKTNIVEAIGYLATHSSHRVATDAPLIHSGAQRAFIGAEVVRADRSVQLDVEIASGRSNRFRVNRSPVQRSRDALGILRVVVFAPEDLTIVKGDPADRRHYIDTLLVQVSPRLAGVRQDYDRVLKQRNALLKSAGQARRAHLDSVESTLAVWDEQLVALGTEITRSRQQLVSTLAPRFTEAYDDISGGRGPAAVRYQCSWSDREEADDLEEDFRAQLLRRRDEEFARGITLVGPHRDELALQLHDNPVRGYASHGETWSVALALRLAAYDVLLLDTGEDPVLVLDDVFAELDSTRRSRLVSRVSTCEQVFVTAAVEEDMPVRAGAAIWDVTTGRAVSRG